MTVRFVLSEPLGALGAYAPEAFDLIVIFLVVLGLKIKPKFSRPSSRTLFVSALSLSTGFLIFTLARATRSWSGIEVPFDFQSTELLVLILLLGPLLEELLFRHALWEAFARYDHRLAWAGTTLLFAYGHFHAWFGIPPEFRSFVVYQTVYVFGLGAVCGAARKKTGTLTAPLLIHFGFNLGFTIAARTLL